MTEISCLRKVAVAALAWDTTAGASAERVNLNMIPVNANWALLAAEKT